MVVANYLTTIFSASRASAASISADVGSPGSNVRLSAAANPRAIASAASSKLTACSNAALIVVARARRCAASAARSAASA